MSSKNFVSGEHYGTQYSKNVSTDNLSCFSQSLPGVGNLFYTSFKFRSQPKRRATWLYTY